MLSEHFQRNGVKMDVPLYVILQLGSCRHTADRSEFSTIFTLIPVSR